jgi:F-type H+-transporting ATPase subunit a
MFVIAAIPLSAEKLPMLQWPAWITNSMVVSAAVVFVLVVVAQLAVRRVQLVPSGLQNFAEFLVESLHDFIEGIVGAHMIRKVFPLLATFFIFILAANWSGLLPGVGSIGWGHPTSDHATIGGLTLLDHVTTPLFRPPNADVNMTLGMTLIFFAFWIVLVLTEQGLWGFIQHTFGPKGGLKGFMLVALVPIFLFVGAIETVSIALRAVSLPIRLFGNNFAGENLLHAMSGIAPAAWVNGIVLVPFYFLELLIGAVQAMVFTLLCAVYIKLNTEHHDEGHH